MESLLAAPRHRDNTRGGHPVATAGAGYRQIAVNLGAPAAVQERVQQAGKADAAKLCSMNQIYFLELVKTRAVTASCQ
jgi:hypothetical protein